MALSDPINVRLGAARRQKTLQKLAQQMASRMGARSQGAGAPFRSASALRAAGGPSMRLPFALPNGRVRPAGFDPQQGGFNPEINPAEVIRSVPGGAGGGMPVDGGAAASVYTDPSGYTPPTMDPNMPAPLAGMPNLSYNQDPSMPYGPNWVTPDFSFIQPQQQGDVPLNQAMPSVAYPDPYTMMMARVAQITRGRMTAV